MPNTISSTPLLYGVHSTVLYWNLVSDGTQETATILYDSSVVCSNIPNLPDPLNCSIQAIKVLVQSTSGVVTLLFDATTDVIAVPIPKNNNYLDFCYRQHGGLKNYAGAGRTGDILITTTGLAAGDKISIVLDVRSSG